MYRRTRSLLGFTVSTKQQIFTRQIEIYIFSAMPPILWRQWGTIYLLQAMGKTLNIYGYTISVHHCFFQISFSILYDDVMTMLCTSFFYKFRLQNNGSHILWTHVADVWKKDEKFESMGLKRTKLTREHVELTPQSIMRVYLAAQVYYLQIFTYQLHSVLQS